VAREEDGRSNARDSKQSHKDDENDDDFMVELGRWDEEKKARNAEMGFERTYKK
jgi:hypothetical protein